MNLLDIFSGKKKVQKKTDMLKNLAMIKLKKINQQKFSEERFDEFVFVFRTFILKKMRIKKQLTHEELIEELKQKKIKLNIKNKIINLSSRINAMEFRNKQISEKDFRDLISRFEELIEII